MWQTGLGGPLLLVAGGTGIVALTRRRPVRVRLRPDRFVEVVAQALVTLGYDASRVKTERFGPTGGMRVDDRELKLDGNAIGGLLSEIFTVEMTASTSTCGSCGAVAPVGALSV